MIKIQVHMFHVKERQLLILIAVMGLLSIQACQLERPELVKELAHSLPEHIDFNYDVKPILSDKCYFCHGPDLANQKAGLRLDTEEGAYRSLQKNGKKAIIPGKPYHSELVKRILTTDQDLQMPPAEVNLSLTDYEKAILIKWIEQGAKYQKHWAYIPPQQSEIPSIADPNNGINEIDFFIGHTLEKNQLKLQQEADKESLLRRVSFDLIGLPPTVEELDRFLQDTASDAYEKVVDRLLTSPHYGEKMASNWMDVARYADTHGYSVDRYRAMWPWRDWVIKAFNENMPYDQFITWQLAGDLLPNASKEQKLATAFNRNHSQNMEGGIVNEEYRIEYVADRTNTLGKAILAMTFECARCHDHKFDAISQKEYFEVFSFFNQVDEAGQISWDNAMPVPTMLLSNEQQDSIIQFLEKTIGVQEQEIKAMENEATVVLTNTEKTLDPAQYLNKGLQAHFSFDKPVQNRFTNQINPQQKGFITEAQSWKKTVLTPTIVEGKKGQALQLNGDDPLELTDIGVFNRSQSFTVGLWIKIPKDLSEGVIFHKGQGAILYSFRGYHLAIRDNKLEAMLAHTWPYNNIVEISEKEIPKDQWVHIGLSYDGSSKASGLKVFLDGTELAMLTEKDNLYKDILFPALSVEPGLRIGARWRGTGIKKAIVDEIKVYNRSLLQEEMTMLAGKTVSLNAQQKKKLDLVHESLDYQIKQQDLQKLRAQLNALIDSIPEIMIMAELDQKRSTHLLERGAYDAPGEVVKAGTPNSILPFSEDYPENRLGLSKWLFAPDNPLTARVIVNRYWQSYFGNGIVKSSADFGNQGDLPTHPKLLDWLAVEFIASGWNVKAMQKKMVMSATYRQSSKSSPELLAIDYDNSLLSRGPSSRLGAEMLRDNALYASGLLVPTIGGESVKPYQPTGLWRFNGTTYVPDSGEKLYRRSLYTFWKRTVPPPNMNTFDAPTRSYCVVKRQKTTTPLQSLVLLNDPQFIEACRALAVKTMYKHTAIDQRIIYLYRALTSRKPNTEMLSLLKRYWEDQKTEFTKQPDKAKGWFEIGELPIDGSLDPNEVAAYTVLANMVMNSSDATQKK